MDDIIGVDDDTGAGAVVDDCTDAGANAAMGDIIGVDDGTGAGAAEPGRTLDAGLLGSLPHICLDLCVLMQSTSVRQRLSPTRQNVVGSAH
jgi:hypothetical protein